MGNPFVSVIVPVYKVERYLPRCIESILAQTYTNFELILVDDGTPDRSGIICDRYADKDSRIKVIHKENGGVSSARNAGIDIAQGEWITFIDSDDWVSKTYFESFFESSHFDIDLIVGSYEVRKVRATLNTTEDKIIKISSLPKNQTSAASVFYDFIFTVPWSKMFKTEILIQKNIRFMQGVKWGEDTIFVTDYMMNCENILFVGKPIYYYNCLNVNSITNKKPYLPEKALWNIEYLSRFDKLLSHFSFDDSVRKRVVSKVALGLCYDNIKSASDNLCKEVAKDINLKTLHNFDPLISKIELIWIDDVRDDRKKAIIPYINDYDVDKIYEYFKNLKEYGLKDRIKNVLSKITRRLIEQRRDNLIKFKF